ncbi:unnamed protein product [Acanthoscelides obtectus]|uniref:Uncharacterized protein n=1 Tax=Acanthoscelides obtectus TaxID=200917 RepID=A0A9P0Q1E5_ACAOB|nr:unnamed protein product [Acanthoscelides obtectus]CAK1664141.1 hypothetical protein AOBTE_LOCUS24079 [Acanthoscelides obtectus]
MRQVHKKPKRLMINRLSTQSKQWRSNRSTRIATSHFAVSEK